MARSSDAVFEKGKEEATGPAQAQERDPGPAEGADRGGTAREDEGVGT